MTRKHFTLHLSLGVERASATDISPSAAIENGNEFPASLLVGDGTYNGLFVPADELRRAAPSMEKQPINIDHSALVEDEVGYVRQAGMFERALRGILVLNPDTTKFNTAKAYIQNRMAAGRPPEVSVGFFCDVEENNEGLLIARNIQFDHLALVTRGACSPENGCGVGMAHTDRESMTNKTPEPAPAAPAASPAPAAPVVAAAEPKPCGCKQLETALLSEKEAHEATTKDRDALKGERDQLKAALAEAPKRYKLAAEAEALGVPVKESDSVSAIESNIALAKAVLAKAPKAPAPAATRFTRPAVEGTAPADRARKLASLAGLNLD
jgi:hypothetical protein